MPITATTLAGVQKAIAGLSLKNIMRSPARKQFITMQKLSTRLGKQSNYLVKTLKTPDVNVSLLLAMSAHLQMNLFDLYIPYLPTELQETDRERQLKTQIATLQVELEKVKEQRDFYKGVAMK